MSGVTTLVPGSALTFTVDVATPPGSVAIYNITITTDPGMATICDVQLMKIGTYLCMDNVVPYSYISTTSSSYFDKVIVDVGSAPNLNESAAASSEENNVNMNEYLVQYSYKGTRAKEFSNDNRYHVIMCCLNTI